MGNPKDEKIFTLLEERKDLFFFPKEGRVFTVKENRLYEIKGTIHDGYIRFTFYHGNNQVKIKAHRLMWIVVNGPIKEGYQIDHKDRNRTNNGIDNLREVPPKDNAQNRNNHCNLTDEEKQVAVEMFKSSPISIRGIARRFNVSESCIHRVLKPYKGMKKLATDSSVQLELIACGVENITTTHQPQKDVGIVEEKNTEKLPTQTSLS